MISALRRFSKIGWRGRLLLAEAVVALTIASIAIALLPFRIVVGFAGRPGVPKQPGAGASDEISRVRWAVEACARRLPWRIVCFQKGLALHNMLRRRNVPTILHYGVAQNDERGLSAHVWITHEGASIIGGREAEGYTCLATYPAAARP